MRKINRDRVHGERARPGGLDPCALVLQRGRYPQPVLVAVACRAGQVAPLVSIVVGDPARPAPKIDHTIGKTKIYEAWRTALGSVRRFRSRAIAIAMGRSKYTRPLEVQTR